MYNISNISQIYINSTLNNIEVVFKKLGLYDSELPKISRTLKDSLGKKQVYYSTEAINGKDLHEVLISGNMDTENSKKLAFNLLKTFSTSLFLDFKDVRPINIMLGKNGVDLTIIDPLFHRESKDRPNFHTVNPSDIDVNKLAEQPLNCIFNMFRLNSTSFVDYINKNDIEYMGLVIGERKKIILKVKV